MHDMPSVINTPGFKRELSAVIKVASPQKKRVFCIYDTNFIYFWESSLTYEILILPCFHGKLYFHHLPKGQKSLMKCDTSMSKLLLLLRVS